MWTWHVHMGAMWHLMRLRRRGGLGGHMAAWEAGSFNGLVAVPEISGAMAGSASSAVAFPPHSGKGYPVLGADGSATMDGAWAQGFPVAIWMADSAIAAGGVEPCCSCKL